MNSELNGELRSVAQNVCSREFAGWRRCSCRISFKIQSNEKFFEIKISRDGFLNSIENFSIEKKNLFGCKNAEKTI